MNIPQNPHPNHPTFRTNFSQNQFPLYTETCEQIANKYGAAFNYLICPPGKNPHAVISTDGALCFDILTKGDVDKASAIAQEFWTLFEKLRKSNPAYKYDWER